MCNGLTGDGAEDPSCLAPDTCVRPSSTAKGCAYSSSWLHTRWLHCWETGPQALAEEAGEHFISLCRNCQKGKQGRWTCSECRTLNIVSVSQYPGEATHTLLHGREGNWGRRNEPLCEDAHLADTRALQGSGHLSGLHLNLRGKMRRRRDETTDRPASLDPRLTLKAFTPVLGFWLLVWKWEQLSILRIWPGGRVERWKARGCWEGRFSRLCGAPGSLQDGRSGFFSNLERLVLPSSYQQEAVESRNSSLHAPGKPTFVPFLGFVLWANSFTYLCLSLLMYWEW